ncbi:YlbD family protein [Bacillus fonticola]|uniref:YlbD family protein n=1 Tax=Bacillus fonticola TaxID=2728853 RepID=UPI001474E756|nr:YlbD family protein [Bacillus fonticola]
MAKQLHPSVEQFKSFVKEHPGLVKEVRKGNSSWQEHFEDWALFGEDDPKWDEYKSEEARALAEQKKPDEEGSKSSGEMLSVLLGSVKKMDAETIQKHLHSANEAITAIQGVLSQFQGSSSSQASSTNSSGPGLFSFRKD